MANINAVEFQQVNKKYTFHHLKPALIDTLKGGKKEQFWALKNVSFVIKKGEKVGLIGRNGSGKTTLLKILSGITSQSSGIVKTIGKIVSLIELDAGFHPDLTGRENIYLNGLLVGMGRQEIEQKLEKIIAFAELGSFIDSPLYTYSSGMSLRLGFSVAIHAEPDILVLDEGIAVGDEGFRKKAKQKIDDFFRQDKTVIVSSHWTGFLRQLCTKVIWLDKGEIRQIGGKQVITKYLKTMNAEHPSLVRRKNPGNN
jgi:lipopolysaccharide transport system ATP-binding protein